MTDSTLDLQPDVESKLRLHYVNQVLFSVAFTILAALVIGFGLFRTTLGFGSENLGLAFIGVLAVDLLRLFARRLVGPFFAPVTKAPSTFVFQSILALHLIAATAWAIWFHVLLVHQQGTSLPGARPMSGELIDIPSISLMLSMIAFATASLQTLSAAPRAGILFQYIISAPMLLFWMSNSSAHGFVIGSSTMPLLCFAFLFFLNANIFKNYRQLKQLFRNELMVKFNENKLQAVLSNVPVGISFVGRDLKYRWVNSYLSTMFRKPASELVGQPIGNLVPHDEFRTVVQSFIESADSQKTLEFRVNAQSESHLFLLSMSKTNAPEPGVMISGVPIDDLQKSRSRELELQAKLVDNAKLAALGDLAGTIVHEINNPMMVISGQANILQKQLAKKNLLDEPTKIGLEKIDKMSLRVSRIARGLRAIARGGGKDQTFSIDSLTGVFADLLEFHQQQMNFKGIEFIRSGDWDADFECQPTQLAQVLTNLVTNSMDALEGASIRKIEVNCLVTHDEVQIRVRDSGPGFDPAIRDKLFQAFATTKPLGKGTGLGLNISKQIIEAHSGSIALEAGNPLGGAAFMIRFPSKQPTSKI